MSITESNSLHNQLEQKTTLELLHGINQEDQKIATAVYQEIGSIESLVDCIVPKMKKGGRLFYIGAGTSGRLGVVDASECPPTFGVSFDTIIGLIAGGDQAIRNAVEFAEDDDLQAWKDLQAFQVNEKDVVIGIAASGRTPYVVGGVSAAKKAGLSTGCITCNPNSELADSVDFPVAVVVGPEYVTGSTRMKAGTAQKLVLNMISTAVMIKLGKVVGNKMVDMQLSNHKLEDRAIKMVVEATSLSRESAQKLLSRHGSVRKAIDAHDSNVK
ncbi:MAG: N-acetylmuramic acid 6-phosphate etherase [Cyclobacteriaceae bacterium]|jgi:N-acetylmuramic acid 6-phosphate etherase